MFRTYDCPVEGCDYDAVDVQDVARHLDEEHGSVDDPEAADGASAGPAERDADGA